MEENENSTYATFGSLGIDTGGDTGFFDCEQIPISDILEKEILLLDFTINAKTSYGSGRSILNVRLLDANKEYKVFTSSKYIRETLEKVTDKTCLPIKTCVKEITLKKGTKSYKFV